MPVGKLGLWVANCSALREDLFLATSEEKIRFFVFLGSRPAPPDLQTFRVYRFFNDVAVVVSAIFHCIVLAPGGFVLGHLSGPIGTGTALCKFTGLVVYDTVDFGALMSSQTAVI
jgi:hypothetical protein